MISTIATHFELIKNCLLEIAVAINNSFTSECLEIRMHAVKCLDVVGYWINMYFTNESESFFFSRTLYVPCTLNTVNVTEVTNKSDIASCLSFWSSVMPKVIEQIQHNNDVAALKSICCDALSNIGSHIFERLAVNQKLI